MNLPIPENLVITWPTDRATDRPSAPQAYQCLLSHFLVSLGAQENADCTSMLSSIESCQNRVSAEQYHLAVSRAQVSTHRGPVLFEVIRWQFTRFKMIAGSLLLFLKFIWAPVHIKYVAFFLVSLVHFPRLCRQYFSLSNAFSIHLAKKTYFLPCSGFFGIFF